MFNVTHTPKPGVCKRRRCSRPSVDSGLCEKDLAEWRAAGSPPWSAQGTPISGVSLVTAGTETKLAEQRIEAQKYLDVVREYQITDQTTMDHAGQFLAGVRELRKGIKEQMDKALAPLKAAVTQQETLYKPVDRLYQETEALLRDKINNHIRMQQEAQDRARVQVEAAGGSVDEHTLVVAHGIENVALPVGMGVREAWTHQVTDEASLRKAVALTELVLALKTAIEAEALTLDVASGLVSQVQAVLAVGTAPSDTLCVDSKRLAQYAREYKNTQEIPGVKFSLTTTATAARARR